MRPGVRSHLSFLMGKVCAVSSISSLCVSICFISFVCLLSCAQSGLAACACCCFLPRQPDRRADSRCAPSWLLMSSLASRSFGASWHQNRVWPVTRSPDFTQRAGVGSLTSKCRRRWEPQGLSEGTWLHVTSETFLSVAAGGSFAVGAFPYFVLSSHLGSFSTLGVTNLLCPGGD